eukprot:scaffold694_cov338-Pavlova_lutheri.AAC.42
MPSAPCAGGRNVNQGWKPSTTKISAGSTIRKTVETSSPAMTNACSMRRESRRTGETWDTNKSGMKYEDVQGSSAKSVEMPEPA